ncbi:MAG: hypothetical protein HYT93_04705 [Parcubacteria group bacterium]|nr:hypothetical protein [Parcubacteria group bacterium]
MSLEDFIEGPDIEKDEAVEKAVSFDALYEVINNIGVVVEESQKKYTPEELIKIIERVRHGNMSPQDVARAFGLRLKVEELLETDPIFKKYTQGSRGKKS